MCAQARLRKHNYTHIIYTNVDDYMCGNCVDVVYGIKNNYEYVNWLALYL